MPVSDTTLRNAKPYKLYDAGGLFIVTPAGKVVAAQISPWRQRKVAFARDVLKHALKLPVEDIMKLKI